MTPHERESLENAGFKVATIKEFLELSDEEITEIKDINKLFPRITLWQRLKQSVRYWWQRRTRGWDDRETYDLDWTVAKFLLPRLIRFKELNNGVPDGLSEEEWDAIINKIIIRLETIVERGMTEDETPWYLWARYSKDLFW